MFSSFVFVFFFCLLLISQSCYLWFIKSIGSLLIATESYWSKIASDHHQPFRGKLNKSDMIVLNLECRSSLKQITSFAFYQQMTDPAVFFFYHLSDDKTLAITWSHTTAQLASSSCVAPNDEGKGWVGKVWASREPSNQKFLDPLRELKKP